MLFEVNAWKTQVGPLSIVLRSAYTLFFVFIVSYTPSYFRLYYPLTWDLRHYTYVLPIVNYLYYDDV